MAKQQYSIDKAERQATLAINRMYAKFASDIVRTDLDTAIDRFGESEKRRLFLAFMQAYAAGLVEANRLIQLRAPKRVFTAAVEETDEPEDDPYIARYANEAIMSLEGVAVGDRSMIRSRLADALERGASIENTTNDLLKFFDGDRIRATRFARTATSDIYNRATLHRYEDSGVVDGVQYAAHIDNRTSEICRVLNRTIWAINDPGIRTPPSHFNCVVAGTQINTQNGCKNIENVEVGDMVLTGIHRYQPVMDVMKRDAEKIIQIKTDKRKIWLTSEHPMFISNSWASGDGVCKCGWINAGDVDVGDEIICTNVSGDSTHEEVVTSVWRTRGSSETVYNLSVLHDESYYANGILVHNCRSRIVPWFGKIPGARDYTKDFDQDTIDHAFETTDTFRNKYWAPFPKTAASAQYQRSYIFKNESKIFADGLNLMIKDARKEGADTSVFDKLKTWVRYRKREPNPSIITDKYGKSIVLDRAERAYMKKSLESLIAQCDQRIKAYKAQVIRERSVAWDDVITQRNAIQRLKSRLVGTTDSTARSEIKSLIQERERWEKESHANWEMLDYMVQHSNDSPTVMNLELQKSEYQRMLNRLNF